MVMSEKVPVSIIVPIKNEAANLGRCLTALKWANEIFVVDSMSTDGSIEIAEQMNAKVVQFEFNGTWPKKRIGLWRIYLFVMSGCLLSMPTKSCQVLLKKKLEA